VAHFLRNLRKKNTLSLDPEGNRPLQKGRGVHWKVISKWILEKQD